MQETVDLYTADDIKKVRKILLEEQKNKCLLTGVPIDMSNSHCDHSHDSEQLVRGALHRHSNMTLGKVESLWTRYLSFWYPHDLQTFLRQAADYLDRPKDKRWRHNGWQKRLSVLFNSLTTKQRSQVLSMLGCTTSCSNDTARKKEFAKLLKDRALGYNAILSVINKVKDQSK